MKFSAETLKFRKVLSVCREFLRLLIKWEEFQKNPSKIILNSQRRGFSNLLKAHEIEFCWLGKQYRLWLRKQIRWRIVSVTWKMIWKKWIQFRKFSENTKTATIWDSIQTSNQGKSKQCLWKFEAMKLETLQKDGTACKSTAADDSCMKIWFMVFRHHSKANWSLIWEQKADWRENKACFIDK